MNIYHDTMKQWYIFDCYGTLVEPISNLWAKAFLEYIDDKKKRIHHLMTTPISIEKHLKSETFSYIYENCRQEIIKLLQDDMTTLYPDAKDIIEHCISQDIPFSILSNLSADYKDNIDNLIIHPHKEYHDDLFKVFYSCDIWYQKPQIQAYEIAINFLKNQGVDHITMIGDNPKYDYLTPKELWIDAKWINRNNKSHNFNKDEVISSFDELL